MVSDFQATVLEGPKEELDSGSKVVSAAWRVYGQEWASLKERNPVLWASPDSLMVMNRQYEIPTTFVNTYGTLQIIAASRHKVAILLAEFHALVLDTVEASGSSGHLDETIQSRWTQWCTKASGPLGSWHTDSGQAEMLLAVGIHQALGRCSSPEEALQTLDLLKGRLRVGHDMVDVTRSDRISGHFQWLQFHERCRMDALWASEVPAPANPDWRLLQFDRDLDNIIAQGRSLEIVFLRSPYLLSRSDIPVRKAGRINCEVLDEALDVLSLEVRSAENSRKVWELRRNIESVRQSQFQKEMLSIEIDDPNKFSQFYWWPPELDDLNQPREPKEYLFRAW